MIVTLCGSARFEPWFHAWNEALSLSGHCVFGLASYPSAHDGNKDWYTKEEKAVLDTVHKAKIGTSHAIVVLNLFAYIGESTLSEIAYARIQNKDVHFLESWAVGYGVDHTHKQAYRETARQFGITDPSPIDTLLSYRNKDAYDLLGPAGSARSSVVARLDALNLRFGKE